MDNTMGKKAALKAYIDDKNINFKINATFIFLI